MKIRDIDFIDLIHLLEITPSIEEIYMSVRQMKYPIEQQEFTNQKALHKLKRLNFIPSFQYLIYIHYCQTNCQLPFHTYHLYLDSKIVPEISFSFKLLKLCRLTGCNLRTSAHRNLIYAILVLSPNLSSLDFSNNTPADLRDMFKLCKKPLKAVTSLGCASYGLYPTFFMDLGKILPFLKHFKLSDTCFNIEFPPKMIIIYIQQYWPQLITLHWQYPNENTLNRKMKLMYNEFIQLLEDKQKYRHYTDDINEARPNIRFHIFPTQKLASSVDLSIWMTPVIHQDDTRACCANALATICEYLIRRTNNLPYTMASTKLSRLFLYYNGQRKEQQTRHVQDLGVHQRSVALSMRKYGLCEEEFWPYRRRLLNKQPSSTAYRQASKYTVVLLSVPITIEAIETCLHNQIPVPIDIIMDDETEQIIQTNNGFLKMGKLKNSIIDKENLHTVVIVGYDRDERYFIMRNSWGVGWGHNGYFYVPYDFILNQDRVSHKDHLWTVTRIVPRLPRLPSVYQLYVPEHTEKKRIYNLF
ncbi:hypothetical protein I4U23_003573 [Adineta vaga]|nr:hypothetical protein I4U23_003573 [Adineta vaga]